MNMFRNQWVPGNSNFFCKNLTEHLPSCYPAFRKASLSTISTATKPVINKDKDWITSLSSDQNREESKKLKLNYKNDISLKSDFIKNYYFVE